jgi:hypothetical protein
VTSVRLRIDHIAVAIGEEQRAGEVEETLRKALALLAARLAGAPMSAAGEAPRRALELLELDPLPADWFKSPSAASRLADELYARIWEVGA